MLLFGYLEIPIQSAGAELQLQHLPLALIAHRLQRCRINLLPPHPFFILARRYLFQPTRLIWTTLAQPI